MKNKFSVKIFSYKKIYEKYWKVYVNHSKIDKNREYRKNRLYYRVIKMIST